MSLCIVQRSATDTSPVLLYCNRGYLINNEGIDCSGAIRKDIEFEAEGDTLRGWLYTPDGNEGPVPTVVMAHGFSAVKEMYLDKYIICIDRSYPRVVQPVHYYSDSALVLVR